MKIIDFIAILGALAWLPHLIRILNEYFSIPEIRIITQRTAEIGFTTFGPILNIRLAFSIKNKEAVISAIKIKLQHASGEERILSWQGIIQRMGEMKNVEGFSIPFEKEQSVLAIKLSPKEIEERLIRFQEDEYHNNKEIYEAKAAKKLVYLQSKDKTFNVEEYLQTEEMKDLITFITHWFNWKQGEYKIIFEVHSPEKFKIIDNEYKFHLSPLDIEVLEKNKDLIELSFKEELNTIFIKDYKPKNLIWNWRNPIIKKIN